MKKLIEALKELGIPNEVQYSRDLDLEDHTIKLPDIGGNQYHIQVGGRYYVIGHTDGIWFRFEPECNNVPDLIIQLKELYNK